MPSGRPKLLALSGGAGRLLCLIALALALLPQRGAGDDSSLEYGVKAAFLLNFTKFVEWPPAAFAEPQSPLEICVLGKDPFGHVLDEVVQGQTGNGRRLVVRRITQLPQAQTCQVLFANPGVKDLAKILEALPPGILTVGEGDHFLTDGGMIALVIDDRRVRFDINQAASERASLRLSAKLLTVARTVAK